MHLSFKIDPTRIKIFHELKKRRVYVGELIYDKKRDVYELRYDQHYVNAKNAIPIGPDLDLFKIVHVSKEGQLFPMFLDRIPDKKNPAYNDYCNSQGISPDEKNPIILLGSIGSRGPSSFVFERVYETDFSADNIIKIRKMLKMTQHDFATVFDIKQITLQRIENRIGRDKNTIKLLQIYFNFPEVALWQLEQGRAAVNTASWEKLKKYFSEKIPPHSC